jgi:hypothetical protein
MAFNAHDFVDAWRSGRELKGKNVDQLIKEMEKTVNSQEGFHPDEEQWQAIRAETQRMTTQDAPAPQPFQDRTTARPAAAPPHSGSSDVGAPRPTVPPGPQQTGSVDVQKEARQKPVADDPKHPETEKQGAPGERAGRKP